MNKIKYKYRNGINFILAYKKNEKPNRKQNKMEEKGGEG